MFPVNIVLGLVWFRFVAAQNGLLYNQGYNVFPAPGIGGSDSGNFFLGTPGSNQAGSNNFLPVGDNAADTFDGVPAGPVGPIGHIGFGTPAFTGVLRPPAFAAVSGQGGLGVPSQGPAFLGGSLLGQANAAGISPQSGFQVAAAQGAGFGFGSTIIQQEISPTVTQIVTVDAFTTLTDLVLQSVPVTKTQFTLQTTTRVTRVVVATPVNNAFVLSTSVVFSPTYVTLTETKSDFRVVVRTSVSYATITHTSYAITHVPFTITATETVRVTSPVVRTIINTSVESVTKYRTVTDTVYVHGGYY